MKTLSQTSLLVVGNGGLVRKPDGFYGNRHTAKFLHNLAERNASLTYCEPAIAFAGVESDSDFNLTASGRVELLPVWVERGTVHKAISYSKAFPRLMIKIARARFVYFFVPGTLAKLCSLAAALLKKPYGLYLRGMMGLQSAYFSYVLSNARFILTAGKPLCEFAATFCPDTEIATPMIDITSADIAKKRAHNRSGPWRLLYVGRLEPRKGTGELLEAARLLKERRVDFELHLVGGGEQMGSYQSLLPHALQDSVRFYGWISDRSKVLELYRMADIFVFPSHEEGFPRVLYEAMAMGVPIVTTLVGGIGSTMKPGENCFGIRVGNPHDIAVKVQTLLCDWGLRERFSNLGCAYMRETSSNWSLSHADQVWERIEGIL